MPRCARKNDPILINATDFIKPGQASSATEVALAQLKKDFMPGVVKVGKHFNMNDLIKACEVYNQNCQLWNDYQSSVFWCQVVGYFERLVSARTAMLLTHGLDSYVNGASQLQDTFKLKNYITNQKISYFPLDTDSAYRLGGGFAVAVTGVRRDGGAFLRQTARNLTNYVEQTQQALESLSSDLNNRQTSTNSNKQ